jgi:hypothetical protein
MRRRLLGLASVLVALTAISFAVPTAAHAAPARPSGSAAIANFLSEGNPSGKTDRHGHVLSRPNNHTLPTPLATPQADTPTPECPASIMAICTFVPAAYHQNTTPDDYGNYDQANRPLDGMTINQIVWHDTEGPCSTGPPCNVQEACDAAIAAFQDPLYYVSAHYLICANPDGSVRVTQMVRTKDVAWHAGNYAVNMHSIGVEIAGFAASGTGYTNRVYWVAAELGKYLAPRFHIKLDAAHMGGHQNVPPPNAANIGRNHMDPGPFWNWQTFYALLGVQVYTGGNPLDSTIVTVAPVWQLNKQPVTGCFPDEANQCANTSTKPTSIAYVHTAARLDSPLVSDPILGPGTTDLGNEVAKVYYGQKFVRISHQVTLDGIWYQVYYNGNAGWILSPWTDPTIFGGSGQYVTPKPGRSSVPVYGRAYPQASTYPADFAGPATVPLPYTVAAGQKYTVAQSDVLTQYYNDDTINGLTDKSLDPYDHVVFTSTDPADQYVAAQEGGRFVYFRLSDVDVVSVG